MRKISLNLIILSCFLIVASCQGKNMNTRFVPYSVFPPSSNNLLLSVQDALRRSPDPVIEQVHVEVIQNQVILSGYVKKIRQSDTAEQIAHQVAGVQVVDNRIIVRQ